MGLSIFGICYNIINLYVSLREWALRSYKAFGLNIQSELQAPDWLAENPGFIGEPDLVIKLAPINSIIPHYQEDNTIFRRAVKVDNHLLLVTSNADHYLLMDAKNIIIEPSPQSDIKSLQTYLFGSVMNIILQQRDFLTIHGCSVAYNGGAYVFVGNCGIGKSSLALTFMQQGFKVTSDDLCAFKTHANDQAVIYPSYPHIKLSLPTAAKLNIDVSNLNLVHPLVQKYFFPLNAQWQAQPLPIRQICILDSWEQPNFNLQKLSGVNKVVSLKLHMHGCDSLHSEQFHARYFRQIKELVDNTPISMLKRPNDGFLLHELVEYIQKNLMVE